MDRNRPSPMGSKYQFGAIGLEFEWRPSEPSKAACRLYLDRSSEHGLGNITVRLGSRKIAKLAPRKQSNKEECDSTEYVHVIERGVLV